VSERIDSDLNSLNAIRKWWCVEENADGFNFECNVTWHKKEA